MQGAELFSWFTNSVEFQAFGPPSTCIDVDLLMRVSCVYKLTHRSLRRQHTSKHATDVNNKLSVQARNTRNFCSVSTSCSDPYGRRRRGRHEAFAHSPAPKIAKKVFSGKYHVNSGILLIFVHIFSGKNVPHPIS